MRPYISVILASFLAAPPQPLDAAARPQIVQQVVVNTKAPVSGAAWTLVHSNEKGACGTGTTCAVPLSSTTSGNVLAIGIQGPFLTASHISSINTGGTLTTCASNNCALLYTGASSGYVGVDLALVLSATGGITSITVTISANAGASQWTAEIDEFHCVGCGTLAIDSTPPNTSTNATCTSCTGAAINAITGTGNTDLLLQNMMLGDLGDPSGVSAPYAFDGNSVLAWAQSTSGTAPTFTGDGSGQGTTAIAIKQ